MRVDVMLAVFAVATLLAALFLLPVGSPLWCAALAVLALACFAPFCAGGSAK